MLYYCNILTKFLSCFTIEFFPLIYLTGSSYFIRISLFSDEKSFNKKVWLSLQDFLLMCIYPRYPRKHKNGTDPCILPEPYVCIDVISHDAEFATKSWVVPLASLVSEVIFKHDLESVWVWFTNQVRFPSTQGF